MSYLDKIPSSRGRGSSILKEECFITFVIGLGLEKTLEELEEYDLSLEITLHEVFIWETVDKKDLLAVSEHDKKYYFLSKFILHKVFVTGTVDEIHLLVISENEVELLTNVLPWTPVELAKQHLILLLETVKF